jgi:hypothetical protein
MTKMKEIKQKLPKPIDCTNCKFVCSLNISEDVRSEICKSFWQLGDYRRQKDFILMNVKSESPKRRRPTRETSENSKLRTNSKSFFLLNKRVCQSFFLKTLAISNGPLIKAFKHKNIYTNFFDGDDKRGKHTPSNKLSDEIVESIVRHFETHVKQNVSKTKKRVITDPDIRSLRHLYSIYKETYGESTTPSYTSFKRIFNEHNFAFPPERIRNKPQVHETIYKVIEDVNKNDEEFEEDCVEEHTIEGFEIPRVEASQLSSDPLDINSSQPKVIVTQVGDNSKFFANPQVYEIQFIQVPLPTVMKHS